MPNGSLTRGADTSTAAKSLATRAGGPVLFSMAWEDTFGSYWWHCGLSPLRARLERIRRIALCPHQVGRELANKPEAHPIQRGRILEEEQRRGRLAMDL